MKNIFRNLIVGLSLSLTVLTVGCDDVDSEITELNTTRVFSPTDVTAIIVNRTGVRLNWKANSNVDSYTIEVTSGESIYKTIENVTAANLPVTITGLEGETSYTVQVKAKIEGKSDSKWSTISFTTGTEQIFITSATVVKDNTVTLYWTAGESAATIVLTPTTDATAETVTYNITADDIANGKAMITGLSYETDYTAVMKAASGKTRGTATFKTEIDLQGKVPVAENADLVTVLNEAQDGDKFVLLGQNYELGEYSLEKSVSISSLKATAKATITGRFTVKSTVGSLTLTDVVIDGKGTTSNLIELGDEKANLGSLTIEGCEIRNMEKHLIYNNKKGAIGTITLKNSLIDKIAGNGGGGIDYRGGALTSLIVENCTFSNGFRDFLRMQVKADVSFKNCTFYKVCIVEDSNNSGLFRMSTSGSTFKVENCLFVETGSTSYGNWCKSDANMVADNPSYANNVYYNCLNLWAGKYKDASSCSAVEMDPKFQNAAEGDFTITDLEIGRAHV